MERRREHDANDEAAAMAELNTVFVDTSLETHLAILVCSSDTTSDFKKKMALEHMQCFPGMGKIQIQSVKVKRQSNFYRMPDVMLVWSVFQGVKSNWFLSVDASIIPTRVSIPKSPELKLEKRINSEEHYIRVEPNTKKKRTVRDNTCNEVIVPPDSKSPDHIDRDLALKETSGVQDVDAVMEPEIAGSIKKRNPKRKSVGSSGLPPRLSDRIPNEVKDVEMKLLDGSNEKVLDANVKEADFEQTRESEDTIPDSNRAVKDVVTYTREKSSVEDQQIGFEEKVDEIDLESEEVAQNFTAEIMMALICGMGKGLIGKAEDDRMTIPENIREECARVAEKNIKEICCHYKRMMSEDGSKEA